MSMTFDDINVKLEEKGVKAVFLREDSDFHYYYADMDGMRFNYKIPLFDAEMIYPGIPAHVIHKYYDSQRNRTN